MSSPRDGGADSKPTNQGLLGLLKGLFRAKPEDRLRESLEELIESESSEKGSIAAQERAMIQNILNLEQRTAADVMVPRADIVAIEQGASLDDLLALFSRRPHSRIPVYRETLDDVAGFIHIKDVLAALAQNRRPTLAELVRDAMVVAPSMSVIDLLVDMRRNRRQLAVIVDEYGGIDGLVTVEDLVEAVVGEIDDEHTPVKPAQIVEKPDGTLLADARAYVENFEELVGPILTPEERDAADTLGGLVYTLAGRVPERGETITHSSGVEFEVLEADPRRVRRLKVRNLPSDLQSATGT
jgi:CBS domain containing-hemolysin-like protein